MLVTFRSSATESITMFRDVAVELLRMMGATGKIPGGLSADDLPAALAALETAIERLKAAQHAPTPSPAADNEDAASNDNDDDRGPPVAITTRAVPLINLMKRAVAAKAELTWEPLSG